MELEVEQALYIAETFRADPETNNEYSLIGRALLDPDGSLIHHLRTTHILAAPNDDTAHDIFKKYLSYKDNNTALKVGQAYQKKISVFLICNTPTRVYSCELHSYIMTTGIHKEFYERLLKRLNISESKI